MFKNRFKAYSFIAMIIAFNSILFPVVKMLTYDPKELVRTAAVGNTLLLSTLLTQAAFLYKKKTEDSWSKHCTRIYQQFKNKPQEHKVLAATLLVGAGFNGKILFDAYQNRKDTVDVPPQSSKGKPNPQSNTNQNLNQLISVKGTVEQVIQKAGVVSVFEGLEVPALRAEQLEQNYFSNLFGFNQSQDYQTTQKALCARAFYKKGDERKYIYFGGVGPRHDQSVQVGTFEVPTVQVLQSQMALSEKKKDKGEVAVSSVVADSRKLHLDAKNEGAVFQAASQFNCLEMVGPSVTPEAGIACYEHDKTQGPACAIPCAAGTAWRNYCTQILSAEHPGQTKDAQINNLVDIEEILKAKTGGKTFWTVKNGYVESTEEQLKELNLLLEDQSFVDQLKQALRIGVQWDTEVTEVINWENRQEPVLVTQTFNSALSIGYSKVKDKKLWEPLARLILEASYEATLYAAVLNNQQRAKQGKPSAPVYLTAVGGGVFANNLEWIGTAIGKAIKKIEALGADLDVRVTYYGGVNSVLDNAIKAERLH